MVRICRILLAMMLLAPVLPLLGCEDSKKSQTKLEIPNVPPAPHGSKQGPVSKESTSKPK